MADQKWKPYPVASDEFVYMPKELGRKPIFSIKSITLSGKGHDAYLAWGAALVAKFPDGEHDLVHQHEMKFLDSFQFGKMILTPTNKYAKLAVEGFLISIQCLKDHGVTF